MRKGHWFRKLVRRGYNIPFAPDDPQNPARPPHPHPPRPEKNLARCRDLLQKRHTAQGLQQLNALAARTRSPQRKAQIAALAADSEFLFGRFENALNGYRAAGAHVANHPRAWLRPAVGEVRALLKMVNLPEAVARARAIWNRARLQHEEVQRQIVMQQAQLDRSGLAVLRQRPARASVVATRLGFLFFLEGELASAREFFLEAITINPQGGSRAREGLAMIALAEGDLAEAVSRARESLLLGKFQAKTIGVWPVIITAWQRQGVNGVAPDLFAGVQQGRSTTVRARTILVMARALRDHHDRAWESIATDWLTAEGGNHPKIAIEVQKLFNAKLRLAADDPSAQAAAAAQILSEPKFLSRNEYVAASKQFVRASLLAGQRVDVESLVQQAVTLYGNGCQTRVAHNLALSCMMARRHDLARPALQAAIAAPKHNSQWAKSLWALARMEAVLGNHSTAAALYQQFVSSAVIPERYRLAARVHWLKQTIAAGDPVSFEAVIDEINLVAGQTNDFDVLMDFARELASAPPAFRPLWAQLFDRGASLAAAQFSGTKHPAVAIGILFRLTRRQVYDFGKYQDAVDFWDSLSADRRTWLWSPRREFWEYLSWIYVAMNRLDLQQRAQQLVDQYLSDPATPTEGRLELMHEVAIFRMQSRQPAAALAMFSSMIALAPMHRLCAESYYWLALAARKNGDVAQSIAYAEKTQLAQGSKPGVVSEWKLDCRAALLRSRLVPGSSLQSANYSDAFQKKCLLGIHADLRKLE